MMQIGDLVNIKKVSVIDEIRENGLEVVIYGCGEVAKRVDTIIKGYQLKTKCFFIDEEYLDEYSSETDVYGVRDVEHMDKMNIIIGMYDYPKAIKKLKGITEKHNIYTFDRIFETEPLSLDYIIENWDSFQRLYNWLEDTDYNGLIN